MAERHFDEALVIMEELVSQNPKDSDYQVGLKQAREGVIDQTLIRVRMSRLANNNQESLELLRKTIERENAWGLFPTGAVAFTQNEETEEAYKTLRSEIYSLNQRGRHLRVLYLIERYKILFPESRRKTFDLAFNDAKTHAKKFCLEKSHTTSESLYFYNQLIAKWCSYANQKAVIAKSVSPLYKEIAASTKSQPHEPLPLEFVNQLNKNLNHVFMKSGWYDKSAKQQLLYTATGTYRMEEDRSTQTQFHSYTEDRIVTAADGTKQKVQESHSYPYLVFIINQNVFSGLNLVSDSDRLPRFQSTYQKVVRQSYHNETKASIGLYPTDIGESHSPEEWLNIVTKHYADEFYNRLRNSFEGAFCTSLTEATPRLQLINQSLICLRQMSKNPPDVINRVFENEYQMTSTEMETLFRVVD